MELRDGTVISEAKEPTEEKRKKTKKKKPAATTVTTATVADPETQEDAPYVATLLYCERLIRWLVRRKAKPRFGALVQAEARDSRRWLP